MWARVEALEDVVEGLSVSEIYTIVKGFEAEILEVLLTSGPVDSTSNETGDLIDPEPPTTSSTTSTTTTPEAETTEPVSDPVPEPEPATEPSTTTTQPPATTTTSTAPPPETDPPVTGG
jgi:hypothetical protein